MDILFGQDEIKRELLEEFKKHPDYSKYLVDSDSPMLNMICSGVGTILAKKLMYITNVKKESFITEARSEDSVHFLAKSFGYRINRYSAPRIKLKYTEDMNNVNPETRYIEPGQILGSYGDKYDIVYIGKPMFVERGDEIVCAIGKSVSRVSHEFNILDSDGLVKEIIRPQHLKSVDNSAIFFYVNNVNIVLDTDLENFIIENKVVDFSEDNVSSQLYIFEYSSLYGYKITPEDRYTCIWLETDGKIDYIDQKILKVNDNYRYIDTLSLGSQCDSIEKLSYNTTFYYQTQRRAVIDDDYRHILIAHDMLKDVQIFSKDVNNKFVFYIHSNTDTKTDYQLTEYERSVVSLYIRKYKMSGVKLYFIPAKPVELIIDLSIKLNDVNRISEVTSEVKSIVSKYLFKLGSTFEIGNVIADVSKIMYKGSPVVNFIYPNIPQTHNLESYEYLNLREENLKLSFI